MMIKLLLIDSINFFTSVGETTYQKLKQLTNECRYAPLQQTCSLEFPRAEQFILPKKQAVHCLDVEKIVSSLSTKNFIYIAPGLDEIPIHVIRLSTWYYSFYYCHYKILLLAPAPILEMEGLLKCDQS